MNDATQPTPLEAFTFERNAAGHVTLKDPDGKPLPDGRYSLDFLGEQMIVTVTTPFQSKLRDETQSQGRTR